MDPKQSSYFVFNKWFLIPAVLWLVAGAVAQFSFNEQRLFAVVNTHHTELADVAMVWITKMGEGVFGTLILLLLLGLKAFRNWLYFLAAFLCNALPALLVQVIKDAVDAPRPLKFFNQAPWIHTLPEWERLMERSFPSGHTCAAFCLFTFLAFILPARFRAWGLIFFFSALLVGYSRIYLAAHFFRDVYFGSLLGIGFTMIIIALLQRYQHLFFKRSKSSV